MSKKVQTNSFKNEVLTGSIVAIVLSIFFVLVFALVMRLFFIDSSFVSVANLIIKISSVFCAVFVAIKSSGKVFLKSIFIAVGFVILSNLLSVVFGGQLMLGNVLKDVAICSFASFVACIIAVGRKKL